MNETEYTGNGTAGREADVKPTGFFFQMPKREWQGLTDKEIENLWNQHESRFDYYSFSCAIEAKLKEKNT